MREELTLELTAVSPPGPAGACACCSVFQKDGALVVLGHCRHEHGGVLCLPLIILFPRVVHIAAVFWGFVCSPPPFSCFLPPFRQHRTVITGLTFSPDGNFMFSACLQGTLALYSCMAQKSHVLRVLGKASALWVAFLGFFISTDILAPKPNQTQPTRRDIF